jgi:hypothetical protein
VKRTSERKGAVVIGRWEGYVIRSLTCCYNKGDEPGGLYSTYEMILRQVNKYPHTKLNSVALVRERTIPTERPPPVGEVSANFCG